MSLRHKMQKEGRRKEGRSGMMKEKSKVYQNDCIMIIYNGHI